MLYSFEKHVAEMRESRKEVICDYEKYVESLEGVSDVKDTEFYKTYLSKFEVKDILGSVQLSVPEDLEDDFDYDLLMQLVCASHSCTYEFKLNPDLNSFRLRITAKSGGREVRKYLDELWAYQIDRLFEIYICEHMNLFALTKTEAEYEGLYQKEKTQLLRKFQSAVNNLRTEKFANELFNV